MSEFEPGLNPYGSGKSPDAEPNMLDPEQRGKWEGEFPTEQERSEPKPPDWRERSHFNELPSKLQEHYQAIINEKLQSSKEKAPEEHRTIVQSIMQEIAGRLHVNLLDGDQPGRASIILSELIKEIVIETEDRIYEKNNLPYIGGAVNGKLILYPTFFGDANGNIPFDREHVISHELGEIFDRHFNPEEYKRLRVNPESALNGDYVDSFPPGEEKDREERAETWADFLRSTNEEQMLIRRFERYKNSEQRTQLMDSISENGSNKEEFRNLLRETHRLRAHFQSGLAELTSNEGELDEELLYEHMLDQSYAPAMRDDEPTSGSSDQWKNHPIVRFLEWMAA